MTLKKRQKEAIEVFKKGYNLFLSGEAGTGKSFVIEEIISYLNKENIKYVVCAPTGLAALNVEGATIHRTFKLSTDLADNQVDLKNVEEAQVIIIDEISMCRRDVFQKVARALFDFENPLEEFEIERESRVCRKKQIVVVGDFFQLPPVLGNGDRKIIQQIKEQKLELYNHIADLEEKIYAFQCEEWNKFNFKNIILNEVVRQSDKDYIDNLNKIRKGEAEGLEFIKKESCKQEIKNAIYLTSKNKDAEAINKNNLDKIKKEEYTYWAEEDGEVADSDKPVSKFLKFKVGARVMSVVNIVEKDKEDNTVVVNGMMGTVADLTEDTVTVEFDNGYIHKFEKYKWSIKGFKEVQEQDKEEGKTVKKMVMSEIGSYRQIPLKLAWAITIHKSQGQTYEAVNLNPNCFCEGQLYVALSRAKDLKKLYLTSSLRRSYLKTSPVVAEFYKKIEEGYDDFKVSSITPGIEPSVAVDTAPSETANVRPGPANLELAVESDIEPRNKEYYKKLVEKEIEKEEKFEQEGYVLIKVPKSLQEKALTLLTVISDECSCISADQIHDKEMFLSERIRELTAKINKLEASSKRRPKIDKQKEEQILELRRQGLAMNKIAKVVKCGDGTVKRVLNDNNMK